MAVLMGLARFCRKLLRVWRVALRWLGVFKPAPYRGPRLQPVSRQVTLWGNFTHSQGASGHPQAKPAWVLGALLELAAASPLAGCRTLANCFNLLYSETGQSISKTWVYERLKARAHALALARLRLPRVARSEALGRVWGVDLTGLLLTTGDVLPVWGVFEHASRTVLQLEPLKRYNSLILLGKLIQAFGEYGKPKAIRSDNDRVFKTLAFRTVLWLLGVKQQFTALHCPWQNGRIERFWRTLKETLGTKQRRFRHGLQVLEEQYRFASFVTMKEVLSEFQAFYNFSRPHQALKGKTPAQVWSQRLEERKQKMSGKMKNEKPDTS